MSQPVSHFISEPRQTPLGDRLKQQLERFMAATERRVLYQLDLGHPEHYAFARDMLLLSGDSPERSPRAFALLDEAHQAGGGGRGGVYAHADDGGAATLTPVLAETQTDSQGTFPPGEISPYNVLARFDVTGAHNYNANAVSTIPGGTNRTSIVLAFVNTTNSQILDSTTQSTTTYAQGEYFNVPLSGTLSGVSSDQVVSNATFYVYTNTSPYPSVYYMSSDAALPATDGCQTAPIYWENQGTSSCANKVPNTDPIIACWYRGCQGGTGHTGCDCDYWNSQGNPTNFTFPVSGSMTFPSAPYVNNGNLSGAFTLFLQVAGGGAYVMANGTPMSGSISGFQVQGNTVTWSFPAAAFPNNGTIQPNGSPANFGLQLSILLADGTTGAGTFTSDRTQTGQSGVFIVPQIQILAGCLVAGTPIRMADGSLKPVEDFVADGRESVRTAGGGTRRVTASTRGLEPVPCVTLRTAGHALVLTEGHAVPTANRGIVAARDLAVGDVVATEDGDQPLTEVGRQPYDGIVHNLQVGTDDEAAAGESTFFAGGILVGDLSMQQHVARLELERRRGQPLEVLPPEWHDEFERFTSDPEVQAFAAALAAS